MLVWYKLPLINKSVFNYRNKWHIQMYTISNLWMNFRLNTNIDLSLQFSNNAWMYYKIRVNTGVICVMMCLECSCGPLLLLSGTIESTCFSFSTKQVSVLYLFTQWYSSYCAHFVIDSNYMLTVHTVILLKMHSLCMTQHQLWVKCWGVIVY
jgi:hypothetical protein